MDSGKGAGGSRYLPEEVYLQEQLVYLSLKLLCSEEMTVGDGIILSGIVKEVLIRMAPIVQSSLKASTDVGPSFKDGFQYAKSCMVTKPVFEVESGSEGEVYMIFSWNFMSYDMTLSREGRCQNSIVIMAELSCVSMLRNTKK